MGLNEKRRARNKTTGKLTGDKIAPTENAWEKNAPSRLWAILATIWSRPVEMVTNAIESFKGVNKNKGKSLPKLKHRKSKDKSQSFIEASMLNQGKNSLAFPLFAMAGERSAMLFGKKKRRPFIFPDFFDSDVTVAYERKTETFYLEIPVALDVRRPDTKRGLGQPEDRHNP